MKELTSHIDYLMQKHDCVIIPEFGGFVLHREVATVLANGSIIPPGVSVGFNPELKYNDGLLAESYMNVDSISYDAALSRIEQAVKKVNVILGLHQPVQIGKLGTLHLNEHGQYIFEPNRQFSLYHPETFGLSTLELRRLTDIHELQLTTAVKSRNALYKRIFTGAGAAAAAVLVFFLASTPISEDTNTPVQKSGIFFELGLPSQAKVANNQPIEVVELSDQTLAEAESLPQVEAEVQEVPVVVEAPKPEVKVEVKQEVKPRVLTTKYYVIVGSSSTKSEANRSLSNFKAQGYKNAQLLTSGSRQRIYIASFENKDQAERYKADFVRKNPRLSDAWIHAQRN